MAEGLLAARVPGPRQAKISEGGDREERNTVLVQTRGLVGFLDKAGTFQIAPQFEATTWLSEGWASVRLGGKWGAIDRRGVAVIPPQFDSLFVFREGRAQVEQDNPTGFVDASGNLVVPFQYADARFFSNGLTAVALEA